MSGDRLKSFGVSSLLADQCKVYYSSLFTSTHLGRVSDLLSARLRNDFSEEVSLRAVLLFQFFHAFHSFKDASENDPWLSEPLVIECGIDDGKLAIGISLNYPATKEAPTASEVEKLLGELSKHCHELVVRYQPESRRFEVVSLMNLEGGGECTFQWVELPEDTSSSTPASQYIELGDLNYAELLETKIKGAKPPKPTGEELTRIAGSDEEKNSLRIVKGGGQPAPDKSITLIKGGNTVDQGSHEKTVVASNENAEKVRELEKTVKDLEEKLARAITRSAELAAARENEDSDEEAEESEEEELGENFVDTKRSVMGFFKKMFKPEDEVEAELEQEDAAAVETPGEEAKKVDETKTTEKAVTAATAGENPTEPKTETAPWKEVQEKKTEEPAALPEIASQLVSEIETGKFNEALSKIQSEAGKDKSAKNGKSKIMIQGAMGELLAERSRLLDMAKKVSMQIKQKDLELKNKERAMQMELKRKDDLIKQKEYSLKRAKDQGAQVMKQLEAAKNPKNASAVDAQYKARIQQTTKLLQMQKEANHKLTQRMEDLQRQLNFAHATHSGQNANNNVAEQAEMNAKLEKSNRQMEELKRTNRTLMEQLHQAKTFATRSTSDGDAVKKLQAAVKKIAEERKENDALKAKIQELEATLERNKPQDPAA